jgi:hypothetical protein
MPTSKPLLDNPLENLQGFTNTWMLENDMRLGTCYPMIVHGRFQRGGGGKSQGAIDAFKATLEHCELHDMGYKRPKYT